MNFADPAPIHLRLVFQPSNKPPRVLSLELSQTGAERIRQTALLPLSSLSSAVPVLTNETSSQAALAAAALLPDPRFTAPVGSPEWISLFYPAGSAIAPEQLAQWSTSDWVARERLSLESFVYALVQDATVGIEINDIDPNSRGYMLNATAIEQARLFHSPQVHAFDLFFNPTTLAQSSPQESSEDQALSASLFRLGGLFARVFAVGGTDLVVSGDAQWIESFTQGQEWASRWFSRKESAPLGASVDNSQCAPLPPPLAADSNRTQSSRRAGSGAGRVSSGLPDSDERLADQFFPEPSLTGLPFGLCVFASDRKPPGFSRGFSPQELALMAQTRPWLDSVSLWGGSRLMATFAEFSSVDRLTESVGFSRFPLRLYSNPALLDPPLSVNDRVFPLFSWSANPALHFFPQSTPGHLTSLTVPVEMPPSAPSFRSSFLRFLSPQAPASCLERSTLSGTTPPLHSHQEAEALHFEQWGRVQMQRQRQILAQTLSDAQASTQASRLNPDAQTDSEPNARTHRDATHRPGPLLPDSPQGASEHDTVGKPQPSVGIRKKAKRV